MGCKVKSKSRIALNNKAQLKGYRVFPLYQKNNVYFEKIMGKRLRLRGKEQDVNGKIQMIRSNGTQTVMGKRDKE